MTTLPTGLDLENLLYFGFTHQFLSPRENDEAKKLRYSKHILGFWFISPWRTVPGFLPSAMFEGRSLWQSGKSVSWKSGDLCTDHGPPQSSYVGVGSSSNPFRATFLYLNYRLSKGTVWVLFFLFF